MTQLPEDLKLSSYDYDLPPELVASRPIAGRHNARLLVFKKRENLFVHARFLDLPQFLPPQSLLVFNQTKVFPCRPWGKKKTGGECEVFFVSPQPMDFSGVPLYECLLRASGKRKLGEEFTLADGKAKVQIERFQEDRGTFWVRFDYEEGDLLQFLHQYGNTPIPPYIRKGKGDEQDRVDYQTVYAKDVGSVAAPTAGLHFTPEVFSALEVRGHDTAFVTLHVGLGTFSPLKNENIRENRLHREEFFVPPSDGEKIKSAREAGEGEGKRRPVFAVGTTSLRVLESCLNEKGEFIPRNGTTDIFLHPGKEIRSVDGLITNFHLPQSSLLLLVSTLIGREKTLELYREAVRERYRFFSYGDAMLILP